VISVPYKTNNKTPLLLSNLVVPCLVSVCYIAYGYWY